MLPDALITFLVPGHVTVTLFAIAELRCDTLSWRSTPVIVDGEAVAAAPAAALMPVAASTPAAAARTILRMSTPCLPDPDPGPSLGGHRCSSGGPVIASALPALPTGTAHAASAAAATPAAARPVPPNFFMIELARASRVLLPRAGPRALGCLPVILDISNPFSPDTSAAIMRVRGDAVNP